MVVMQENGLSSISGTSVLILRFHLRKIFSFLVKKLFYEQILIKFSFLRI